MVQNSIMLLKRRSVKNEEQTNALKHDELFKSKSLLGTVSGPEPLLFFGRIWGVDQEMLNRVD
ncbi:hypothetical protein FHR25_004835 [Yokenella regensburgei]|nr:hypothetical protein FHR25_004835 [Yokenella regensburgei]